MRFKGEDLNIDGLEIRKLDVAGRLIDIYVCLLDNL